MICQKVESLLEVNKPIISNLIYLKHYIMKVKASVKRICRNCKIVRREGIVRVICVNLRHKQRQG